VDGQGCDGGNKGDNSTEHDDDEPGCAVCGLWRGLSDAHGVDEGVRDEQEEFHRTGQGFDEMVAGTGATSSRVAESEGLWLHLYNQGLPERWQAHTL
jgi:hypothetical protein